LVQQPVQFIGSERIAGMVVPTLGENTEAVLTERLGLDAAQLASLRKAKVI
jgi:crotonobetainyl-CoA:carnitine CoA-transferase CaiB-like acyl-CoA transferase